MIGKPSPDYLEKIMKHYIGINDENIVLPPRIGEDASAVSFSNEELLVVHSNPITSAHEKIGWLAIHVAGNDLFATGVKPKWYTIVILIPTYASMSVIEDIMLDVHKALLEINASLIGGHTEFTAGLQYPIVIATAMGKAVGNNVIPTSNAGVGDYLIMTKTAALEATGIIACEFKDELSEKLSLQEVLEAKGFIEKISIREEALLLSLNKVVSAMHDPTEGGVLQGALEIAYASKKKVKVFLDEIPVHKLTWKTLSIYGLNPYNSLSSGSLLATVPEEKIDLALEILRNRGIQVKVIGKVVGEGEGELILSSSEGERVVKEHFIDDYISWLKNIKTRG